MTQTSEERIPHAEQAPSSAQIIPFERPQNPLQRAVQQRAQEHLDAQSVKPKKSPARMAITFAAALIPVALIFSGFLVAVQAVRLITSLYLTPQESAAETAVPEAMTPEPPQPGVVMLVPDKSIPPIEAKKENAEETAPQQQ